jgi:uncharacterized protein YbjQ (UPF0145 family)|tara:strand:+ start:113740 stop:114195 length:456 start_codon:yes stop_codon:yes gene_type:complete
VEFFDFLNVIIFLIFLSLGALFGTIAERRHFSSIARREAELAGIIVYNTKYIPQTAGAMEQPFVSGFVVISHDYLKSVFAAFRKLFGGRVKSYETLAKRAKREAVLRLKEMAHAQGATAVYNVRVETSSVSKGQRSMVVSVEAFAYGTAVR